MRLGIRIQLSVDEEMVCRESELRRMRELAVGPPLFLEDCERLAVCNAPQSSLPTSIGGKCFYHSPTPMHTGKRSSQLFCPRQLRYLGRTAPLTASVVGDRSLMWAYHITGTPGCSTPKADNQHSMG